MRFTRTVKVSGLLIFLAFIISFTVFIFQYNARPAPGENAISKSASEEQKANMLINQDERNRIQQDYTKKTGNGAPPEKPKFIYELSPAFRKKLEQTPGQNVLGVSSSVCNLGTIPAMVYVYNLQSHWATDDSKKLSKEYGVRSIPYSMPTETSAFQYLFINVDNSAYFTQYEPSGVYTYNRVANGTGPMSPEEMRQVATRFLKSHKLDKNLNPPDNRQMGDMTMFTFRKSMPNFPLVDEASLQSFFDIENCSVTESDIMGLITVGVRNDGSVTRLINNTRTAINGHKVPSIPFEKARQEYADSQPIDPIIFPANADLSPTSTLTIDAAVIAYYDVGLNFGQELYVPVYIAHGFSKSTTGQDVQILTFFPAVSANDLLQKGLIHDIPASGNHSTQQQGVLPFATPTPYIPPLFPNSQPGVQVSGPGCSGNTLNYVVSCSVDGKIMCRGIFNTTSSPDYMNACNAGCKVPVGAVDTTGGKNPCEAFIQQNNIPPAAVTPAVPRQRIAPNGVVTCMINACPS